MANKRILLSSAADDKNKPFYFKLPQSLRKRAKIVCAKRDIQLAEFVRESMEVACVKYEKMFY